MNNQTPITQNRKNWLNSLGGKFVIPIISILIVTLGSSAIYTYNTDKNSAYASLFEKINNLSHFVVQISPNSIFSFDYDSLNNYMESLTSSEDIVYAVMVSPNGKPMTTYLDYKNEFVFIEKNKFQRKNGFKKQDILKLTDAINIHSEVIKKSYPIIFDNEILATIHIGINSKRIEAETRNIFYQQLVVSLSIILLLSVLIYSIFRIYTLRPITQLIDGAVRLSNGNLEKEVTVYSKDELGELAQCFNTMMNNLKSSIHEKDDVLNELQNFNRNLENRVEQRTAELIDVNKELEHLALHDTLTGLPNRSVIQDSLKHNIHFSKNRNEQFCVFMMDLDRFKEVNDTLGHNIGDQLLQAVSKRLKKSLRDSDIIGRLGGDEFAIILPKTEVTQAAFVADKIRKEIEPEFLINNHALSISVSIGISCYPTHGTNATELMKAADVAMYHSKNTKVGRSIYHDSQDKSSPDQLNHMGELRDAINNEDLCLYYQPKVNAKSQKIIGVEALVRWKHKTRGLIFPDNFIPLAEKTGLIKPLTTLVLKLAMQQMALWTKENINITIAVNLSMHDVQDESFPDLLSKLIESNKINHNQLVLEITESTIMSNPVSVMSVLEKISNMGVNLSIDDFGTGYSSFSNLKKMPVNELKIDRSFVMDMLDDKDDLTIVESTINLAHNMGLKVVAEGVESNEISKQLIDLNCDIIQGYYISKPVPAEEISQMIADEFPENSENRKIS